MATSTSSMRSTIGSSAGGFLCSGHPWSLRQGVRGTRGNGGAPGLCQTGRDACNATGARRHALRGLPGCSPVRSRASRASRTRSACRAASGAVVVLVDGLGAANIQARAGHARFLAARMAQARRDPHRRSRRRPPPPSRASRPGRHAGRARPRRATACSTPAHDRLVNQLNGWDAGMVPETWQRAADASSRRPRERGIRSFAVGAARYADSGFTHAVLRGAEYRPAATIADRFAEARALIAAASRARSSTSTSPSSTRPRTPTAGSPTAGSAILEELDAELAGFERRMPRGTGLLVTADHGVVDVPAHRHVFVDDEARARSTACATSAASRAAWRSTSSPASTPRPSAARRRLARRRGASRVGRRRATRRSTPASTARSPTRCVPRIGDVHRRRARGHRLLRPPRAEPAGGAMIGQHGSLSDEETRVPLVRGGAFTRAERRRRRPPRGDRRS